MTTPPPQGNPFAQGQQPAGQPQAPYPPQGGYPQQPAGQPGFPQQGAAPYAPVPPQQPKRGLKQYLRIAGTILALLVVAGGWYLNRNAEDAKKLAVGDCLYNKGTSDDPEVVQVDCGDTKATHTVLKKADGSAVPQLTCQSVTGTTATLTWQETGDSFTLCLGDNK
ncbi:LppU/SCO3897 family protein [Streptomyces bullii]|uniref:Ig-like domain-containing protein n=1 Tax=Streptomyces bullii TaxID=349910 RepID=A0ABW0ULB3_9ACTN